jgi:hypothetical protein
MATGAVVTRSGLPAGIESFTRKGSTYTFRAVVGLPQHPFPAYASYVVEGQVNLARQTGVITTTLFAGAPEAMSTVVFPGMTRVIRVTHVERSARTLLVSGSIDDRAHLWRGESGAVEIFIDPVAQLVRTGFLGVTVPLGLRD